MNKFCFIFFFQKRLMLIFCKKKLTDFHYSDEKLHLIFKKYINSQYIKLIYPCSNFENFKLSILLNILPMSHATFINCFETTGSNYDLGLWKKQLLWLASNWQRNKLNFWFQCSKILAQYMVALKFYLQTAITQKFTK